MKTSIHTRKSGETAKDTTPHSVNPLTLRRGALGLLLLATTLQAAPDWQEAQEIQEAARAYISGLALRAHGVQPGITVDPPDRRLRLPRCPQKLEAFMPPGGRTQGRTVVGIRCPEGAQWSIFVPVQIKIERTVVVAGRPLPRGTRLKREDLKLASLDVSRVRGSYITELERAIGTQIKRPLSVGQPLTSAVLAAPRLIKRGQTVRLVLKTGAITVRSRGKALADGAPGDRIRVRNRSSKRIVEGKVISSDTVQLGD